MPKRPPEPESALYVRLPANAADKLDRAADLLGIAKKDLVAAAATARSKASSLSPSRR